MSTTTEMQPLTKSLRIAVADDEPDMREYLEKILPRMGHQVVAAAENGRELIELFTHSQPDLVITDLRMPQMNGDEALRNLASETRIPFIAVSAFSLPQDFGAGLPDGSWVYLNKPIKREDLERAISSLFPDTPVREKAGEAPPPPPRRGSAPDETQENGRSTTVTRQTDLQSKAPQPTRELDLLIADDDDDLRSTVAEFLGRQGHHVWEAGSGQATLELITQRSFDVAILDLRMPDVDGVEILRQLKETEHDTQVVMLTGQGTIESAVEAMKLGAHDFLVKPVTLKALAAAVDRASQAAALLHENRQLRVALKQQQRPHNIVGHSPQMQEVFRLIERIGPSNKPILIQGESGTGKELVAMAIHQASILSDKPLVTINCAALPETLLESELFGHEKGAFTGAINTKPGLFEVADGGTLFIDEIGELAGSLQAKLLRVLEDGSLRRIGSVKERRVHVRLLAATNRDMAEEVKAGRYREDLFYRINVLTVELPPLRERTGDLALLIRHFAGDAWEIEKGFMETLGSYTWPGNVRQLINAIDRAKILSDDEVLRVVNLPPDILQATGDPQAPYYQSTVDDLESLTRQHVMSVYNRCEGNKARTARELGINRRSLYRLLEKYGIHETN